MEAKIARALSRAFAVKNLESDSTHLQLVIGLHKDFSPNNGLHLSLFGMVVLARQHVHSYSTSDTSSTRSSTTC
jgi:hypothetical protein